LQNRLKALVETLADRAGYRIIPKWRLKNHVFADHLIALFSVLHTDIVLDVGANRGQYHDFLRDHVGFTGPIWSFEPIPELASQLELRAKSDPAWRIFHTALGATAGTLALNVMQSNQFSSFLLPTDEHTTLYQDSNAVARRQDVPVTTLDALFAEHAADFAGANIYLKMDTQGFDLEVLKGGQTSLPRIAALQTELCITPIYQGMPSYIDVLQYLERSGFSPSAFFAVNDTEPHKTVELDCCMVNNRMK
jgi:FkbM family methyltransferase